MAQCHVWQGLPVMLMSPLQSHHQTGRREGEKGREEEEEGEGEQEQRQGSSFIRGMQSWEGKGVREKQEEEEEG